jgi:hypothetical protein
MKYLLVFCILATATLLITHRMDVRYQEGIAEGKRLALNTTNPSHALENACLSLWIGEQNKKAAKEDL